MEVGTSALRLNLVVLRSPDMHRAIEYYRTLGLEFTLHAHGTGPQHYSAEIAGMVFEIYPLTAKSAPTAGMKIGFQVESVDRLVSSLSALGATVVNPPTDSEWGRRAVVKDFDGHTVELLSHGCAAS